MRAAQSFKAEVISLKRASIVRNVDALGDIEAQMRDLAIKAEIIKEKLGMLRAGPYEGKRFTVTVSKYKRPQLDMVAVRRKLTPQFICANTRQVPITSITVRNK